MLALQRFYQDILALIEWKCRYCEGVVGGVVLPDANFVRNKVMIQYLGELAADGGFSC